MGFSRNAGTHELQQIEEINSLLVGGEQRGPSHQPVPGLSSTIYNLHPNDSRSQHFPRGPVQPPKLSFADHPDMRVLSSGQVNPTRRASAPQLGFHVSPMTSQPIPRQLPFLYSCMYSSSDIAQHPTVTHQPPDSASTFDMSSSFSPVADTSSSRPTTSGSDFSTSSTESMYGFSSDPTSPSMPPTDDPSFGFYQDANLAKMGHPSGVDLVSWSGPGFFGLDTMAGFDTFGNVPQC